MPKPSSAISAFGFILVFFVAWLFLAKTIPPWMGEVTHMSIGKGIALTGKPVVCNFDTGEISGEGVQHVKGMFTPYLVGITRHFFGEALSSYRLVPLLFTFLTFFLFIFYFPKGEKPGSAFGFMAAFLFFGQSLVLQKSLYVHIYAPLAFFFLMSLICVWNSRENFRSKNFWKASVWFGLSLLILLLPTLDHWPMQFIPVFILAVLLAYTPLWEKIIRFLDSRRRVAFLVFFIVIIIPFLVPVIDVILAQIPFAGRPQGRSFSTYWDNVVGLIQFLLVTNVCWFGIVRLFKKGKKEECFELDAQSWIYLVGILSGLMVGLFAPDNTLLYLHSFYLPTVLVVLGFSGMFATIFLEKRNRIRLLAFYVCFGALFSWSTFYFDRGNAFKAIAWLKKNLTTHDALVVSRGTFLSLYGGEDLMKRSLLTTSAYSPEEFDDMIHFIDRKEVHHVYIFFSDHYWLKYRLYQKTTGVIREQMGLFRHLISDFPGENILKNLRGCRLYRYEKEDLLAELQRIRVGGFPGPVDISTNLSWHRRILRKILVKLGYTQFQLASAI